MILHCIAEHLLLRCSWTLDKLKELDIPVHSRILLISDVVDKLHLDRKWFNALCYASQPSYFPLVLNYLKYLYFLKDPRSETIAFLFSEALSRCPYQSREDKLLFNYTQQKMKKKCKAMLNYHRVTDNSADLWKIENISARSNLEITLTKCYTRFRTKLEDLWEKSKGYPASRGNDCYKQYFVSEDCSLRLQEIESMTQRYPHLAGSQLSLRTATDVEPNCTIPPYQMPMSEVRLNSVRKYVDAEVPSVHHELTARTKSSSSKSTECRTKSTSSNSIECRNKSFSTESKAAESPSKPSSDCHSLGLQSSQNRDREITKCIDVNKSISITKAAEIQVIFQPFIEQCVEKLFNERISKCRPSTASSTESSSVSPDKCGLLSRSQSNSLEEPLRLSISDNYSHEKSLPLSISDKHSHNEPLPLSISDKHSHEVPLPLRSPARNSHEEPLTLESSTSSNIAALQEFMSAESQNSESGKVCKSTEVIAPKKPLVRKSSNNVKPLDVKLPVRKTPEVTCASSSNICKQTCRKSSHSHDEPLPLSISDKRSHEVPLPLRSPARNSHEEPLTLESSTSSNIAALQEFMSAESKNSESGKVCKTTEVIAPKKPLVRKSSNNVKPLDVKLPVRKTPEVTCASSSNICKQTCRKSSHSHDEPLPLSISDKHSHEVPLPLRSPARNSHEEPLTLESSTSSNIAALQEFMSAESQNSESGKVCKSTEVIAPKTPLVRKSSNNVEPLDVKLPVRKTPEVTCALSSNICKQTCRKSSRLMKANNFNPLTNPVKHETPIKLIPIIKLINSKRRTRCIALEANKGESLTANQLTNSQENFTFGSSQARDYFPSVAKKISGDTTNERTCGQIKTPKSIKRAIAFDENSCESAQERKHFKTSHVSSSTPLSSRKISCPSSVGKLPDLICLDEDSDNSDNSISFISLIPSQ